MCDTFIPGQIIIVMIKESSNAHKKPLKKCVDVFLISLSHPRSANLCGVWCQGNPNYIRRVDSCSNSRVFIDQFIQF